MNNESLSKPQQFLWIVQTTLLANGLNLATNPDTAKVYRHCYSANGVMALADEALRASQRIPDSLSAYQAASEFCTYMLSNLRRAQEEATEHTLDVPAWFARP